MLPPIFFLFFSAGVFCKALVGTGTTLHIANKIIAPDGYTRSAVLAQGIHPAPLITGKKGDKFQVNVVNSLTDNTMLRSTSIHWHGLFQRKTPYEDGPVGVTQCPISPNRSYRYEFSVPDQAGTFWYHSHYGTQYCDGLRGALVVYDPHDPHRAMYDVDDESTVITLSEWYHRQSPSISGIAVADATLINGKGRYIGGPLVDLATIDVVYDGHTLTIIEADGQSVQPHTVDSIQIFAGQRYSFVLHANQKIGNYWIRALPNSGLNGLSSGYSNSTNSAILRYKGALKGNPTTSALTQPQVLSEANLHPLADPAAPGQPHPGGADVVMNLALGYNGENFTINGQAFVTPTVPVLLQMMSGRRKPQELMPTGSLYPLPLNKVIELNIPGGLIGSPHPFHLHGHSFSVIRSAGLNVQPNYINPIRRDVVSIGDVGSNVTIRFKTDNPGPWFLHCHIDFHLNSGLAIVFAEDTQDTRTQDTPPASWKDLCPVFDALPASATSVSVLPTTTSSS